MKTTLIVLALCTCTTGAILTGCNMAKGKYIYVHNSDLEYDPKFAPQMLELSEKEINYILYNEISENSKDQPVEW